MQTMKIKDFPQPVSSNKNAQISFAWKMSINATLFFLHYVSFYYFWVENMSFNLFQRLNLYLQENQVFLKKHYWMPRQLADNQYWEGGVCFAK